MSRIDDLLERQAHDLATFQDRTAREVLKLAADARRELREQLDAMAASGLDEATPYTAQHHRVMLAQADAMVRALDTRIGTALDAATVAAGDAALKDLLAVIRVNEPDFVDAGGAVEMRVLQRYTVERGLLLHAYSTRRYSAEVMAAIQRELSLGLLRGANRAEMVTRITKVGTGTMAALDHRAELIARMESNAAYGNMHAAALEEASAVLDEPGRADPLLRQMSEFIDARNSPASRAADGIVAALTEPFRVPVAEVVRWERLMKKRAGITKQTPVVGGYYEVHRYPFHFGERGRQIPYRTTWDDGASLAKMKGPQLRGIGPKPGEPASAPAPAPAPTPPPPAAPPAPVAPPPVPAPKAPAKPKATPKPKAPAFTPAPGLFAEVNLDDGWREAARKERSLLASRPDLSDAERKAVRQYTTEDYKEINSRLRASTPAAGGKSPLVKAIDAAMARSSMPENVVTWRGAGRTLGAQIKAGAIGVGDVMEDRAFMSTSIIKKKALDFNATTDTAVLKIRVPEGARGMYVDDISDSRGEYELLLPRGTRLHVRGIRQVAPSEGGYWEVECEIVPTT